ncbi:MAG: substrate-binding domain-containing protein [Candidatus Brocadiae bacterium]|nr:substrate-binding domain-containing protein [Candidatus Brocadiia bacterium]
MRRAAEWALRGIMFVVGALLALHAPPSAMAGTQARPLEVFAPWCMEKRLRRIVEVFQEKRPSTPVRFATGTPGQLIKRVRAGGKPDVYIAMGPCEIEVLQSMGLVDEGSAREILRQTLLLAVSEKAKETVAELRDLAKKEVNSVGMGRPTLTSGRLARAALGKLGILDAVAPKAKTSPLRQLVLGQVQAAVLYEQCCYEEDLHVGKPDLRRDIAAVRPLSRELCEPFPVVAAPLKHGAAHPDAAVFVATLCGKRAQDILHRRGDWSCPICEMVP